MKSFDELYNFDISGKVKKNNGLSYLNWLDCFLLLRELDMQPEYTVLNIRELSVSGQIIVDVWVKIGDKEAGITYTDARSRDFEFIKQRAFVKCVAINWGLGLKLWESDSDPAVDDEWLNEAINKAFANLVGPNGADEVLKKLGMDKVKFGKVLSKGAVEEKKAMLQTLNSMSKDDPF